MFLCKFWHVYISSRNSHILLNCAVLTSRLSAGDLFYFLWVLFILITCGEEQFFVFASVYTVTIKICLYQFQQKPKAAISNNINRKYRQYLFFFHTGVDGAISGIPYQLSETFPSHTLIKRQLLFTSNKTSPSQKPSENLKPNTRRISLLKLH